LQLHWEMWLKLTATEVYVCVVASNSSVKINTDRTAIEEGSLFYLNQTLQTADSKRSGFIR
jgi:hypothetical protein